ncbi:MAG TPA: hypothetical protein VMU33_00530 [Burkholderiaceae bacterium]|nr:hypothetical protein [Burkholderiaceae bacterium]
MKILPIVLLLSAAAILGILLGIQYLRRQRLPPVLIGLHLILGAGGLELLAVLLRGAPDGVVLSIGSAGRTAAGLLAAAMFTGLVAPLIGRGSRTTMNVALLAHVGVAVVGIGVLFAWVIGAA